MKAIEEIVRVFTSLVGVVGRNITHENTILAHLLAKVNA